MKEGRVAESQSCRVVEGGRNKVAADVPAASGTHLALLTLNAAGTAASLSVIESNCIAVLP